MKAITPLLLFVAVGFEALAQDSEGFVLVKSEPPIELHERWVEFPNKKPAVTSRELKTEFIVKAPIHKVINIIRDESHVKDWHAHIRDYKIYHKPDSTVWEEYACHDIPWPLNDQDSFLEYKLNEIVPGYEYQIVFKSRVDKKIPVYDNINRVELVGSWKFILIEPGVVKVIYRVQSAPTTNVPRMIVDPVIRNNLVASIRSLTVIAEK
jgi:hypothetical protein